MYDPTFEVLLTLARVAKAGQDTNAILVATVEAHFDELALMPEFLVSMGLIPRPANVIVPWLLTAEESQVTQMRREEESAQ